MDKRIGKNYKFSRAKKAPKSSLWELFEIFYNAKVSEGRSPRTLEMYRDCLRYLCEYMELERLEFTITAVTPDVIRSYMSWLLHGKRKWEGHAHKGEADKTIGLSPVTVNTRIKGLRTMFRFLNEEGHISSNPCLRVGKAKEPVKKIRILTVDELKRLLGVPDRRSYAGFRDYVAINVLIDSFARIGEILSLKKSDIDFKLGMVWLDETKVKTRRGRGIPLTKRTLRLLKELIEENADFSSDYVFLTNYGEPIRDDRLRDRIKQHAREAGIEINVHPHLFRHTSATMFLEKGGDLRHLASILGHTDLRMVMKYTHLSDRSIKAQHEVYSPIHDVVGKLGQDRKTRR
ncbi:tyrosine-type recombinase/integrase [Paenibacillus polymyxa]|nr:tyrosine-type recombinase/integrase [Paenibacillus polymyxa]